MESQLLQDYNKMQELWYENPNSEKMRELAKEFADKYGEEALKDFWRESDGF